MTEYPVEVSVRQGAPFELGQARADIIATVREGHKVVDIQEWQREVEIDAPSPHPAPENHAITDRRSTRRLGTRNASE